MWYSSNTFARRGLFLTSRRSVGVIGAAGVIALGSVSLVAVSPPVAVASPPPSCLNFSNAGATGVMTCDVPSGVLALRFIAEGAGGGGAGYSSLANTAEGVGGNGAKVTYDMAVTPGETLTLEVGTGGGSTTTQNGAGGGGWTAVKRSGTILMVAAGGGGAGVDGAYFLTSVIVSGGDGSKNGTADGGDGKSSSTQLLGGSGATTSAGGNGGLCTSGCASVIYNGNGGIQNVGGDGSDPMYTANAGRGGSGWQGGTAGTDGTNMGTGGGGGAGYYGGGGGSASWFYLGAGGGAGSSYPATGAKYETATNGGAANTAGGKGSISIVPVPPPTVTSVSPTSGSLSGGTSVTITGTEFVSGATVTVGGAAATSVTVVSDTQITATTPAGTAGAADIVVTNPIGLSGTGAGLFTYTASSGGGSGSLDPVAPGSNPAIPADGLPAGESVLLVDGVEEPVRVQPNATNGATALVVTARGLTPDLTMRLEGRGDTRDPLGLTSRQVLILQSRVSSSGATSARSTSLLSAASAGVGSLAGRVQPYALSSGGGFKANSEVKFYFLPSTYLGSLTTDASGDYSGRVRIPAGITPGTYTMQVNGFAPDDSVRSLSIGVRVTQLRGTTKTSVWFVGNSPVLSNTSKARLRSLATGAGSSVVKVDVSGFVLATTPAAGPVTKTLSAARAANVARYLRSLGIGGVYVSRGRGRDSVTTPQARRVDVTVTFIR